MHGKIIARDKFVFISMFFKKIICGKYMAGYLNFF